VQAVTVETFAELGRHIAAAKQGVQVPRERLLAGCRAYLAFGIANPHLYGLLFQRNRLLRGQEAATEDGQADTRDPEAGPFGAMMKDIRACAPTARSSAPVTMPVLSATSAPGQESRFQEPGREPGTGTWTGSVGPGGLRRRTRRRR